MWWTQSIYVHLDDLTAPEWYITENAFTQFRSCQVHSAGYEVNKVCETFVYIAGRQINIRQDFEGTYGFMNTHSYHRYMTITKMAITSTVAGYRLLKGFQSSGRRDLKKSHFDFGC